MIRQADQAAIIAGAALLTQGKLVAFPTETVYGLGADATNDQAVAAIYAAKNRPSFNPLIVHVASPKDAERLVRISDTARLLMDRFWPGPLTLVLPRLAASPLSLLVSAGLDSVAIRQPDHMVAQRLIAQAGHPVAAPSANRSGTISPTCAQHVDDSLGDAVDLILDGGPCRVGLESTVLDLTQSPPALLRPGGVAVAAIERVIGQKVRMGQHDGGPVRSPGMMTSHYAPACALRLNQTQAQPGEALLAFGPGFPTATLNLSVRGDLTEAAANLFAMMRHLDTPSHTAIAVTPIPDQGLGLAINDRLMRAAAPKDHV